MPIEVSAILGGAKNSLMQPGTFSSMAANPILTAVMILATLLIFTMWVFRDVNTYDESLFMLSLRLTSYMSIVVLGVLFIHNAIVIDDMRKANESETTSAIFNGVGQNTEDIVPVTVRAALPPTPGQSQMSSAASSAMPSQMSSQMPSQMPSAAMGQAPMYSAQMQPVNYTPRAKELHPSAMTPTRGTRA